MQTIERYPIDRSLAQLARALGLSPQRVMRRAGLDEEFLTRDSRGVTAEQFFRLWEAVLQEAKQPDLPVVLGQQLARGPFNSAIFAFSCSPDVATGVKRLALFKPLVGPIRLDFEEQPDRFHIFFRSADGNTPVPASLSVFELTYFLELLRYHTGEQIRLEAATIDGTSEFLPALERYLDTRVALGNRTSLVLSAPDAKHKLISENAELWEDFEPHLRRRMADRERRTPMSVRVRNALLEMLPSGTATAEAVCQRLHVSKRSLQRHLKEEGKTFQSILDATRSELSLHYLSRGELSVKEISYLLAYRDPNSFYRAFHSWTGMTPQEARGRPRQ